MRAMSMWGPRAAMVCLHLVQFLVTASADLRISSVIAALLLGVQLLPRGHFVRIFRVRPNLVSQLGSLVWLLVAVLEMGANR